MKILGRAYADGEVIKNHEGRVVGLSVEGAEFHFVGPLFDEKGDQSPLIPLYPPVEVRALTHETPDLTEQFIDEIRAEFDELQRDCREKTAEDLCKRFWPEVRVSQEALMEAERCRARNLEQTFAQYRDGPGRDNCWIQHGSDEMANALGYLAHWPDDATKASVEQSLIWRIANWKSDGEAQARKLVRRAQVVAIYADEGKFTRVFLEGLLRCARPNDQQRPLTREHLVDAVANVAKEIMTGVESRLLPILSNLESLAKQNHAGVEATGRENGGYFAIKDMKTHFEIVWDSVVLTSKPLVGMGYLKYFLEHPGESRDARWLQNYVTGKKEPVTINNSEELIDETAFAVGKEAEKDSAKKNLDRVERRLEEIRCERAEINGAQRHDADAKHAELDEEVETLEKEAQRQRSVLKGKRPDYKSEEMGKRSAIKSRIYETLRSLKAEYGPDSTASTSQRAAVKEFTDHVKHCLMNSFESEFQYNPDPTQGIDWQA